MHISYLAYVRIPTEKAHGVQIMKVCEALADAGAEVELVTPGRETHIKEDPFVYYGVKRNFKLSTIRVPDFMLFGTFGFIISQCFFGIRTLVKQGILISQDEWVLAWHLLCGRRGVYEVHNGRWNFCARYSARNALCMVANSEGTKRFYVEKGIAQEKIMVLPNGVDIERFAVAETQAEARKRLNLPLDTRIALYTGHLYDWKGAHTLADSAKSLPEGTTVVFVGGTERDVQTFRGTYGAQKNISILGHQPNALMPLYLRASDVLVLPNARIGESEQFTSPMKLFEYLAAGKPIVASDLPSIREVLREDTAFFFTPGDAQSLAKTIQYALEHAEEAQARASLALTKARSYTWNRQALVERIQL
jgi:glycosyltransferase involved in cell wall biosynthesis